MTQEEAINARELLLVEQRKVRQAIRILQSESIIPCAGISMAIGQYNRRLHQIDDNIREIAEQYSLSLPQNRQVFSPTGCSFSRQVPQRFFAEGSSSPQPLQRGGNRRSKMLCQTFLTGYPPICSVRKPARFVYRKVLRLFSTIAGIALGLPMISKSCLARVTAV